MPRPIRDEQFVAEEVCVVHVVQRCVRRAFLAGVDKESGNDYSFRKEWIRRRMEALASVFAVDVLAYAVMSNHMHQILRNRPDVCGEWDDHEVAIRWLRVFPGRRLEEHLAEPTENDVNKLVGDRQRLAEVRRRLSDISWFMRALAEPIARMANKQDDCTGRFWEGRFKAQRIVDEAGLLACSMYVDLNPVRAAMATNPEQCQHTSAYDRAKARRGHQVPSAAFDLKPITTEQAGKAIRETSVDELRKQKSARRRNPTGRRILRDGWLAPLKMQSDKLASEAQMHADGLRSSDKGYLPVSWAQYWELLRWTADFSPHQSAVDGLKAIPKSLRKTLADLGIDVSMWRELVWNWQKYFGKSTFVGSPAALRSHAAANDRHHHRGQARVAPCFT